MKPAETTKFGTFKYDNAASGIRVLAAHVLPDNRVMYADENREECDRVLVPTKDLVETFPYYLILPPEMLHNSLRHTFWAIEEAVRASRAASDDPRASLHEQLLAAFSTVESDDRGRQLAMYEMTTWALRRPDLAPVAQRQYEAYRRMVSEGLVAGGIDPDSVPALPALVTAVFDGLTLSWLADPEGTDVDGVLALLAQLVTEAVPARRPVRRRTTTRRT